MSSSNPCFTGQQDALMVNPGQSLESLPAARPQKQQHVSYVFTPSPCAFLCCILTQYVCTCRLCVNTHVCLWNLPLVNVTQPRGKETFPAFHSCFLFFSPRTLITTNSLRGLKMFLSTETLLNHYYCILIGLTQSCNSIQTGSSMEFGSSTY